jgi:hypothetical protein
MTVVPGDIVRVSARFKSSEAGDIVNVWHWQAASGSTGDDDEDVMDAIDAKLSTMFSSLATNISANVDPYDIRYDIVDLIGGEEKVVRAMGTRSWVLTTPPTASSDSLPLQDAAILNFRTSIPKVFGRKYIGGLVEASNAGGVLSSGMVTALGNFCTSLLSDITVSDITLAAGVLTRSLISPAHFVPFLSSVVNAITGTQRRRRPNRGS